MSLINYIEATRKVKGYKSSELEQFYFKIFSIIKKTVPFKLNNLNLEVIYTTNKTAEIVNYKNNEYLLYDQYLGQVFNMLNRLFFNSKEPIEAVNYGFKLLAEDFQILGFPQNALILALAYRIETEKSSTYKNDIDQRKRANYTFIQEFFVMVHEIIHHSPFSKSDMNIVRENTITLLQRYQENDDANTDDTFLDSYLTDRHKALYGTEDTYKDFVNENQFKDFQKDFSSDFSNFFEKGVSLVQTSDELIEEIICDDLAATVVIHIMLKKYRFSIELILDALYVGMMNLRILGIINNQANSYINGQDESSFFRTSQIRLMRYRDKATFFYWSMAGKKDISESVHKLLTGSNIRYAEFISDPVLFNLKERLDVLKKASKTLDDDFDAVRKYNSSVNEVLGNPD